MDCGFEDQLPSASRERLVKRLALLQVQLLKRALVRSAALEHGYTQKTSLALHPQSLAYRGIEEMRLFNMHIAFRKPDLDRAALYAGLRPWKASWDGLKQSQATVK